MNKTRSGVSGHELVLLKESWTGLNFQIPRPAVLPGGGSFFSCCFEMFLYKKRAD